MSKERLISYKGRFILIIAIMGAVSILLTWLAFHPDLVTWNARPVVIALFVFSIVPIYPLVRLSRNRGKLHALTISLLIGALMSGIVYMVGDIVLQANAQWVNAAATIEQILIIATCLLFILNAFMRRNRQ